MKFRSSILFLTLVAATICSTSAANAGGGHEHGHHEAEEQHDGGHVHDEEGKVKLSAEAIKAFKIDIREARPSTLAIKLKVSGRMSPISSKVAHIAPRFPGIIKEVRKDVGDYVNAGDVLAVVESNQNLQPFEVRTLKGGIITDRHATTGESIKEDEALFVVMDLSQLWADFTIFQRDIGRIKLNQPINIYLAGRDEPYRSKISLISSVVDETTQSRIARAVINDPDNLLAPGAFVTGNISIAEYQVPLAVSYDAIQTIEGKPVIFVQKEEAFEKRQISLGRSDGTMVEVLSGVQPGERYVATSSFILKAELGKNEAQHEH